MNDKNKKRSLVAIVGASAATALFTLTPKFEGEKLAAYRDIGGVITYCDGATENAEWGRTYSKDECRAQLEKDLARHAEGVMRCVHAPLTEGQKVAYVDMAYNVGIANFCKSSVARKANAGDVKGSCDALLLWNKVVGRAVAGLTKRREAERQICLQVKGVT